jgi:hypothetical protein
MAFRKEIDFYFLGSRNYVNGLTIFEEMIKASHDLITRSYGSIKNIHLFKIHKFVRSNCSLVILGPQDQPGYTSQEVSAIMSLGLAKGQDIRLHLLERKEPASARLVDYDRGVYINRENGNDIGPVSVHLRNIKSEYDLIRAIVEANYRHCVALAADHGVYQGVSWAYIKNFPWFEEAKASRVEVINFQKLSVFPARERIFFIRTFSLNVKPEMEIEIGFFFNLPKPANDNKVDEKLSG